MSYAIIRAGGKQLRVEKDQKVRVPSIRRKVGASVDLDVLMTADGDAIRVGAPLLETAHVKAIVVDHGRAPKLIVFKQKRRKHYKRKRGHRQGYTTLKIESIE